MKKSVSKDNKCDVDGCEFASHSEQGLKVHKFRMHTKVGQRAAKRAGANFGRRSSRRKAGRLVGLQHAAKAQVRFCPNCSCNIEAVSIAMAFQG